MKASLVSATSLLALLIAQHGPALAVVISDSSTTVSFGSILVGPGDTKTASTLITVSGASAGSHLTVTGTSASYFGPSTTQVFSTGTSTSSSAATFTFGPLVTGAASTTVTATDSSGGTPLTLTLTGTGVAPLANVTASQNLGAVLVNNQSAVATVTVSNAGNASAPLGTIGNLNGTINASSSVFTGAAKAFSLADKASTTNTYTYAPTTRGVASQTVTTTLNSGIGSSNASGSASTLLTATGVAPVALISTSSANYFLVNTPGTASVTVSNVGNGNLASVAKSVSNLNGSLAAPTGTGFTGAASTFSLNDTTSNTSISSVSSYTFTPTVKGATASALVVASLSNGSTDGANKSFTQNITLTGTGVAPVQSVTSSALPVQARVGTSVTATTTIANIGNGNLATGGVANTLSNLNGSVSDASLGAGVTTTGKSFSLADAATTTFGYTFTPISRGTVSSTSLINFSNGNSAGTNTSQTVSSVFVNQGVAPVYSSGLSRTSSGAGAVTDTPTPVANGSIGAASSNISFGTVGFGKSATVYLVISNTSPDVAAASLTNLTIENYSISGLNASSFSLGLTKGSVISEGGQLLVPLTVIGSSQYGLLNSSLTIFTDESAGLGGIGNSFTYALSALSVPEPSTIAVLGAGLAALASIRRRRR